MRNVKMPTVSAAIAVAIAAVALAGCASRSGQEPSVSRLPSAATGAAATQAPTSTATPTVADSAPSTGAPSSSPSSRPAARTVLLTGQGLGGVPVGAALKEYAVALGGSPTPLSATDKSVFADHSCVIRQLSGVPGVGLMVIGDDPDGQVRRVGIMVGSDIRTDTGIALGSSLARVRAAYGPGLDEPFDHYPVGGDAVLIRTGDNLYLAFIGDAQDQVVELRLGYRPEALYPEGCV